MRAINIANKFLIILLSLIQLSFPCKLLAKNTNINYNLNAWEKAIIKEQELIFKLIKSNFYGHSGENITSSYITLATKVLKKEVPLLTDSILKNKNFDLKTKSFFLSRVLKMLELYKTLYSINMANISILSKTAQAFLYIITHNDTQINWRPWLAKYDVETQKILLDLFAYKAAFKLERNHIILHYIHKYPQHGLKLAQRFNVDNFDTIFNYVLHHQPEVIFKDLNSRNSILKRWYKNNKLPAFQLLLSLTKYHKSQYYFPFYQDLLEKRISIRDIHNTVNFPALYFRLLSKVRLMHIKMISNGDTPINQQIIWDYMLQIADQHLITPVNNLHNTPDNIRFKRLQNFSLYDLYYLLITGNENLYTSSYLYIYKMFLHALGKRNGFNFLKNINFDKYRKFLKGLATYGRLYGKHKSDFLNSMDEQERITIMRLFVNSIPIDKIYFIEDAIDVASTLTGIENKVLLHLVRAEINNKYQQYKQAHNKKGTLVYYILQHITKNSKDSLALPNYNDIYHFNTNSLYKEGSFLAEQIFFYSDEDSDRSFNHLIYTFTDKKGWKIIHKADWIEIHSRTGLPIHIYANRPLREINQGYLTAQIRLKNYLLKNNIIPSIVMHRGHSYFVENTINNISPHVRMVILGSCGSFSMVSKILLISPKAHLISTRQIGKTIINSQLFYYINDELRLHKKINWEKFWPSLTNKFTSAKNYFQDYIPPNKNLGAIFIKYYYKMMSKSY